MSQALYRKWRPRLWAEVVGQEHIVTTLRNAITGDRVAHAYLFAGPRGTGKTTTARLLAKAVNCLSEDLAGRPCNQCEHCAAVNENRFMDLIEIDAASNTSVEDVRDLRDKINYAPSQGKYKVYIIDEVHMLSTAAFNALLKTLEEPPAHAIFILATTEVHKIPATVLSRCQCHEFRRIPVDLIVQQLQKLADEEHIQVTPDALTLIARQSTGAMRDAISLLDQLSSSGQKVTLSTAQRILGTATSAAVIELVDAILDKDPARGLVQIHKALDAGTDNRQFARQVVEHLRNLLMARLGNGNPLDVPQETQSKITQQANTFETAQLIQCIKAFNNAATDLRGGWFPGLLLELALTESLEQAAPAAVAPLPAVPAPAVKAARPLAATPVQAAQPSAVSPARQVEAPTEAPAGAPASKPAGTPPQAVTAVEGTSAAASQEPAAAAGITFPALMQQWPRIRALIKKNSPQTEGLLNSSHLLGIKDGALMIGLGPILKQKMETGPHLEITSRAIAHVTGVTLDVKCSLQGGKTENGLPAGLDVEDDGIVGTAMRDLGGKVVDVQ